MTKDRGALTKTEAKRLRIEHSFLPSSIFKFVYQNYNYSLAKPDPCFSFESPALQDYNNKASDDEPATGTCMLGYRSMMVGNVVLAHKASVVR